MLQVRVDIRKKTKRTFDSDHPLLNRKEVREMFSYDSLGPDVKGREQLQGET